MSNPAWQLHDVYSRWRIMLTSGTLSMRDLADPLTQSGAAEILRVMGLLKRIDSILTDLEAAGKRVQVYRRQLPDWMAPALGYAAGWGQYINAETLISEQHMDEIESFAGYLEGKVYEMSEEQEPQLRSLLDQARTLLEQDDALSNELKRYINRLLASIQTALDDDAIGAEFDMAGSVRALWVALQAAENDSDGENRGKWRAIWTQILTGTASGAMVNIGTAAATAAITSL